MTFGMNDFQGNPGGLNHLVRAKALDLANAAEDDGRDRDTILSDSVTEAEKWFDTASEDEKEDIRSRYPEDMDVKD